MNIVIWKNYGQLGNRLLTFSNILAFATSKGWRVHNLSFDEYANQFHHFQGKRVATWPPSNAESLANVLLGTEAGNQIARRVLGSRKCLAYLKAKNRLVEGPDEMEFTYDQVIQLPPLAAIPRREKWIVWTAWNLHFDELRMNHRNILIEAFRPVEKIAERVEVTFSSMPGADWTVGVHIRRGDYAHWLNGRYYFAHELYRKLMDRIVELLAPARIHFVLASDEPVPQRLYQGLPATRLSGTYMEDLFSLAKCNLIVGPPSTFADWAAFYGGGMRYIFKGDLPQSLPLQY